MNRFFFLISILTIGTMLFSMPAKAQTNRFSPQDSRNDISAGFGWMIPLVQGDLGSECNEGTMTRAEFRAGLTPGYIYGDGRTHRSSFSVITEGDRYNWSGVKGTEVGSRFCLNLNPELHYIITNSYNIYSMPDKGVAETRPQRWQFSFMFSFGLKL